MDIITEIVQKLSTNKKVAVSPPGWGGTVEHMKQHKNITNPWALVWHMSKKKPGDKWGPGGKLTKKPEPHYKEKKKSEEIISEEKIEKQCECKMANYDKIINEVIKNLA